MKSKHTISKSGRWRICLTCNKEFEELNRSLRKYCSKKCRKVGFNTHRTWDRAKNLPECETCHKRVRGDSLMVHNRECQFCEELFCDPNGSKKTCSPEWKDKLGKFREEYSEVPLRVVGPKRYSKLQNKFENRIEVWE